MKTFKDLDFKPWITIGYRTKFDYPEDYKRAKQAILDFPNGYGVSVLFGDIFYSNGIDTYEVGVRYDGHLTYDTNITDDVISNASEEEVTEIMKLVQNL